jgi:hypothetical protein
MAGIFRKYAGGTLRDTLFRAFPPPVYYMTKYEFLMEEKESGRLKNGFNWVRLPNCRNGWRYISTIFYIPSSASWNYPLI